MTSPKCAIVTGAGSGINLAFAQLLLTKGYSVIIADIALTDEATALLSKHPHPPPTPTQPSALYHATDVTSWSQLTSLWATATTTFPRIDLVVPGAGIFEPEWSSFWRSHPPVHSDHYAVLDVNLTAPIRLCQLAIAHWTTRKETGCLVNVGSTAGYGAGILTPLYFASKHGLHGFVRSLGGLRDELGIRVSCVAPGAVKTNAWTGDPAKAAMLDAGETDLIDAEEIAQAMWRLVVDPELGDGTILEASKGATRVVPMFDAPVPTGRGLLVPGYKAAERGLYDVLKNGGLELETSETRNR